MFVLVVSVMNTLALLVFLSILHPCLFSLGNMSAGYVFLDSEGKSVWFVPTAQQNLVFSIIES